MIILMFMGITLGSSAPGFVSMWGVPDHGWKLIFLLGGVIPLVIAACLIFTLPESVKYLVRHPNRHRELVRTMRKLRPDLVIPDDAQFVRPPAPEAGAAGVGPIFKGGLASITLLLWLCFATTLMANYFLNSWMPVLFEAKGVTPGEAAFTATMYHFGGLAGGLVMSVVLDRFGFLAIALLLAVAAPALLAIGVDGMPVSVLIALVTFAGFAVIGAQFGGNAAAGLIYPTDVRSKGVGLALAIGRIGSIVGPFVGAVMFGLDLPMPVLLLTMAVPLLVGAIAALMLARITRRRFGGWRLGEVAVPQAAN
jgi:AAHS family 4-hydroxybenzoate transporter-like MFS transporter